MGRVGEKKGGIVEISVTVEVGERFKVGYTVDKVEGESDTINYGEHEAIQSNTHAFANSRNSPKEFRVDKK